MKNTRLTVIAVTVVTIVLLFGEVQLAGAHPGAIKVGTYAYANLPNSSLAPRLQAHRNAAPLASTNAVVVTEDGPVGGAAFLGVERFLAIPYAAPPVGNLRWMPPQLHGKWHGVLQPGDYGNFCTQPDGFGGTFGSEDCLTLNLFAPLTVKNQNKKRPLAVMVWIHGGGLTTGGSTIYDPRPMVQNGNVIVVTINYRLGLLGFFAHPAIDAEGHLNGNYGLMDQQFALEWVKRNIAAFGGDPNRVTIFGESAGGQSVYAQLASPTAAGLFQRAISESGAYAEFQGYFDDIVPLAQAETFGTGLVPPGTAQAANVGCPDQTAQCLRTVPASTLALADPGTAYPFLDGTILTQTPASAFSNGQFNRVPVISGGNHDEWRVFVDNQYDASGNPLTDAQYPDAVASLIGSSPSDPLVQFLVNTEYPLTNYPAPAAPLALSAMGTDFIFACPERNAVRSLSQYVTTYAYEFNDENAPALFEFPGSFPLGAYHFAEVPYLFDLYQRFLGFDPFSADQHQLISTMVSYWTTFAANGDPNSAGEPSWSPYSSGVDQFRSLIPPAPVVESSFNSDHKCSSLWSPS